MLACRKHLGSVYICQSSEVTMEARLTIDQEIEVRTKLVCYWGMSLLKWHVVIIWDQILNKRIQKWPWRPDFYFWVLLFWQINIDPKWSPHANLAVPSLNKTLVLSWPLFQNHLWAWPPWSLLSPPVLANQYRSQKIPTCQLRSAWPQ